MSDSYIGRFAPTPSGPLHFGSIVAALGSFLDARSQQGKWLLRIEDIDTPRVKEGACDAILKGLECLSLHWDDEVIYQSQRLSVYEQALDILDKQSLVYKCYCPRKLTKGKPYPGTCRDKTIFSKKSYSLRVKTNREPVTAKDYLQKELKQSIGLELGDFNLKRSDGLFAYHLALVVDDAWQNITHVVRGVDLWDSTPRQIYLQNLLNLPTPRYCHLPVAVNHFGRKISKTNHAQDILSKHPPEKILFEGLQFLGQNPDASLDKASVKEILQWGIAHWELDSIPDCKEIFYQEPN